MQKTLKLPDMKWAPQSLECLFDFHNFLFSARVHKCLLSASFGNLNILIPYFLLVRFVQSMALQLDGILDTNKLHRFALQKWRINNSRDFLHDVRWPCLPAKPVYRLLLFYKCVYTHAHITTYVCHFNLISKIRHSSSVWSKTTNV